MNYFSRRNQYIIEYSGHEEVSSNLRARLNAILAEYIRPSRNTFGGNKSWSVDPNKFYFSIHQEFPKREYNIIVSQGDFHEVFTVVEIFLSFIPGIYHTRQTFAVTSVIEAFELSGSVYTIDNDLQHIILKVEQDTAKKIDSVRQILMPYPEFSNRFYQAVGALLGRRSSPENVVKDVFVAAEGYLKAISSASRFGDSIKELDKQRKIIPEQKKILEALNQFASDAEGARHAGNSPVPTEQTALWFVDTLVAQLRMIDKAIKK